MAPVFKNESLTKFWHWLNSQVLRSLPGQVGGSEKNPSTGHQLIKESGDHLNPEPGSSVKPLLPFASKAVQTGAMPPGFPELSMKELITTLAARQKNGHLKQKNTAKTKAAEVNSGIEEAPLLNSLFPEKPKPTAEKLPQMIPLFPNRTKGKKAAAVAH